MRVAKPALEVVREYAAERGCTQFDAEHWRFIAPDRSRAIRIREVQSDRIYIFDTAAGISVLPRERKPNEALGPVTQSMETDAGGGPCGRPRQLALKGVEA